MDNKVQGAWLVHHSAKLKNVTNGDLEFEQISFAGKCGTLLSSLSADSQKQIPDSSVQALARAANIHPKLELPGIISELENQKLILKGEGGIEVLGMTSSNTLEHTFRIFDESSPHPKEKAAIELAEKCSDLPIREKEAKEYISDSYKLNNSDTEILFKNSECIGFVDSEQAYGNNKLLFNGNLFRIEDTKKTYAVLNSLSDAEASKINEINGLLQKDGCISVNLAKRVLGEDLFAKVHSIALFDVNTIGNESGTHEFLTKPSAFNKFSTKAIDDAFDLAKAFVTSLTYGMKQSHSGRGRIQMINLLVGKLLRGEWIGPATAIGHDYQALELKGVVKVEKTSNGLFRMKLEKKEVGRLALQVINDGDASESSLDALPAANVSIYQPPETARELERKDQTPQLKQNISEILDQLRTGGIK
ncbi:hypothetical protein AAEU28_08065 [Pseudoalteromonas sp. SS15]|uniref:hypothetical protein n=1 Tax=Pseudoalteromonas sp. SS15 TaxID=3139393 RepID=UPI003BAC7E6B